MTKPHDDLLSVISKFTIIIPLSIIILALFMIKSPSDNQAPGIIPTITLLAPTKAANIKFDLNGPLICEYKSPTLNGKALVKNKKAYIEVEEKKLVKIYLLNGDCLYSWVKNERLGQKSCGLTPYISVVGLMGTDSLGSLIPEGANLDSVLNSCKKNEVEDLSVFAIPKTVQFKEVPINLP